MDAKKWTRDHKLQFWSIAVGAVVAIAAGIVVPIVLSGGGSTSVKVAHNAGQINVGGTVNNYFAPTPTPSAACATPSDNPDASSAMLIALRAAPVGPGACWSETPATNATPVVVKFEVSYQNTSDEVQSDVAVRVLLPDGVNVVPHSTYLYSSLTPNGELQRDDTVPSNGGQDIGTYAAGANAYVDFAVTTPDPSMLQCGPNTVTSTLGVRATGLSEMLRSLDLTVVRTCPNPKSTS